ncbi:S-protein homolog 1-like [Spinacia oleracea]|uniref:S-protein homolog n=1 Tax=Spinacia oleracea TaxID=3562 RepID=A0ABM3R2Z0_SPIOL|nr:S-protein homolog 1-like [Spinacia oleracea]
MNPHGFLVHFLLLILAITIIKSSNHGGNKPKMIADAYGVFVKYHIAVINGLSNETLNVHCKSDSQDKGLQILAVNTNFTWSISTSFTSQAFFNCNIIKEHGGKIEFLAFLDNAKFIDDGCGGRHCFWKARDNGLYLWHIPDQIYVFKYGWQGKF